MRPKLWFYFILYFGKWFVIWMCDLRFDLRFAHHCDVLNRLTTSAVPLCLRMISTAGAKFMYVWPPVLLSCELLTCYDLLQQVDGATHDAGGTLDAVCKCHDPELATGQSFLNPVLPDRPDPWCTWNCWPDPNRIHDGLITKWCIFINSVKDN